MNLTLAKGLSQKAYQEVVLYLNTEKLVMWPLKEGKNKFLRPIIAFMQVKTFAECILQYF